MVDFPYYIREFIDTEGIPCKETSRSFILTCPECGRSEKLYVEKTEGNFTCFSASCGNKGQFYKYLSQVKDISIEEAKARIYGVTKITPTGILNKSLKIEEPLFKVTEIPKQFEIFVPEDFVTLDSPEAVEGVNYALKRGIDLTLARKYGILYSVHQKRLVYLCKDTEQKIVGYQGRAIGDVPHGLRMRNSTGFPRDLNYMFLNMFPDSKHLIVAEGPVDAIKFDHCGGNIAAFGKQISDRKIAMLNEHPCDRIYWALDEDANDLIRSYSRRINKNSYFVSIPENAKKRILASGKEKADFGECTFEECKEAFLNAQNVSSIIIKRIF